MTARELSDAYSVPEKIVSQYLAEFLVNTPGTNEYLSAETLWGQTVSGSWGWSDGAQDTSPTVGVTAFNPPPAYATTQRNSGAWMLDRISNGDKAFYGINFAGTIDYRLGSFGVSFSPYVIQDTPLFYGLTLKVWRISVSAWVSAAAFYGVAALIAMSENGLSQPYDINRLRAALHYINAAKKYGQELAVSKSLAKQKAAADTESFRRTLNDNLRRESNDLEQKKLSMRVALSGQRAAAIGNMQNALINLQSLKF